MTVQVDLARVTYATDGTVGPFPIPYYFIENGDITASLLTAAGVETALALNTDYTLTGAGNENGGALTLVVAVAAGSTLAIINDPEITQKTRYPRNDKFPSASHELALDRLTIIAQRTRDLADRSIRISDAYIDLVNPVLPIPEAGRLLRWNVTETGLENVDGLENTSNFTQSGVGMVSRSITGKLAERVSIGDAGGGPAASAAVNAAAIQACNDYLSANFNGGRIWVPKGAYALAGGVVRLDANVVMDCETLNGGYDSTDFIGGTTFTVPSGAWAVRCAGRFSGIRGGRFTGAGGTPVNGIVCHNIGTVLEGVSVDRFTYGFVGAQLNSNRWRNILAHLCTVGFAVLPLNTAGRGAFAYPELNAYITGGASTIFNIEGGRLRSCKIGMVLMGGRAAKIAGVVFESNDMYDIIVFKRSGGEGPDNITWDQCWFENTGHGPYAVAGINLLKTSAVPEYLKGSVYGVWGAAADDVNAVIYVGSDAEDYTDGGVYTSAAGGNWDSGPPTGLKFRDCNMQPWNGVLRLRAQRNMLVDRCVIASAAGASAVRAETNSYKLHLNNPSAIGLPVQVFGMRVQGTGTLYDFDEAPIRGKNLAVATGTWIDMCDLSLMTKEIEYNYSACIVPSSNWTAYGATGKARVIGPGPVYELLKEKTGANCDVQITGAGVLQYKQTSGLAKDITFKVWPGKPFEPVSN